MKEIPSSYSQRSAKKTLIFVMVLLGLVAVFAFLALYTLYKQSSVMTQSTYYEKQAPTQGFPEK